MNMRPEGHSIVASQACLLVCVVLIIACAEVSMRIFNIIVRAFQ